MQRLDKYLTGTRLIVHGGVFSEQEFSNPKIDEIVVANGARLDRVVFRSIKIKHGSLGAGSVESHYDGCVFVNCELGVSSVGRATFRNCRFENSKIRGWISLSAQFVDCVFESRLERVVFDAHPLPNVAAELGRERNRFEGNDFRGSIFRDVAFRGGVQLAQDLMPTLDGGYFLRDGESAYTRSVSRVRGIDSSWANDVLAFLEVRLQNCRRGQVQDYISPLDVVAATGDPDGRAVLNELLREGMKLH